MGFADAASQKLNPTAYYDEAIVETINAHNALATEMSDGCISRDSPGLQPPRQSTRLQPGNLSEAAGPPPAPGPSA